MRREEITARVDELACDLRGPEFVAAVEELSAELDQDGRDLLGAVLLERAGAFENAVAERAGAKGWLRRRLDPSERRRPPSGAVP
jgi:hypothetical protein